MRFQHLAFADPSCPGSTEPGHASHEASVDAHSIQDGHSCPDIVGSLLRLAEDKALRHGDLRVLVGSVGNKRGQENARSRVYHHPFHIHVRLATMMESSTMGEGCAEGRVNSTPTPPAAVGGCFPPPSATRGAQDVRLGTYPPLEFMDTIHTSTRNRTLGKMPRRRPP